MPAPFDSQVCIVSDQPLPNLMPALDSGIGRDRVVLLETPRMAARADALEKVLAGRGRQVFRRPVPDDGNLPAFRRCTEAVLAEFPDSALNATGGQKTMSLLAFDVWRAAGRPVFYVERDNRLIWLHPVDAPQGVVQGHVGVAEYFAAFGQSLQAAHREPDPADGAAERCGGIRVPRPRRGDPQQAGRKLESQVFRIAREALALSGPRDRGEILWGVRTAGDCPDELDIVAVRDGVLFIIECKNTHHRENFNVFLNKLETMRQKRGLTARAALVTTAPVDPAGGIAKRAREANILLIGQDGLSRLRETLRRWFAGERLP